MINFNGNIIDDSIKVFKVSNRNFRYGDGIFETIKVLGKTIHFLEEHYLRLTSSMRLLNMEIPIIFSIEFFKSEILKIINVKSFESSRVRFTVYRTDGGLYLPKSNKIEYVIEVDELNPSNRKNCKIDIFRDFYINQDLLSTIKTSNKIINVLASIFASENNFDNCVLINRNNNIVEAMNGNVFVVNNKLIKTPPLSEGCIDGIIRKKLLEILKKQTEYILAETEIHSLKLENADEVFITNSIIGIQAVSNYKNYKYNNLVSKKLTELLDELV